MEGCTKFSDILSDLISDNALTINKLSEESGCQRTNLCMYLNHHTLPTIGNLIKLADYFNCTTDYLLGLTEKTAVMSTENPSSVNVRINELLKQHNLTKYRLSKNCGITQSAFYRWDKLGEKPRVEHLIVLGNYFGCSIDYLIGRSNLI